MSKIAERFAGLSPLKQALLALDEMQSRVKEVERARREPLAIIGMGCRFPGGAENPERYWQLLRDGVDAITEVPADRWDADAYYDPDPEAPGKIVTRQGGFVEQLREFDAAFFGISPREAVSLDPQQRLLLEVAWEALENAGVAPDALAGSPAGVFVAICTNDYSQHLAARAAEEIDAYMATGTAHSVAAGRLSYLLGLQGPCVAIDTACSSSLVTTHLACQSLRNGECDLALAAGVSRILSPTISINFSRARMLAPDGRCRTFDASADGFGRGEGCGVIVLKRLSDALAEGDDVCAVIRGSALNQDGRTSGLTVPSGPSQAAVIRRALEDASVAPVQVGYIEAHGTGTALGDPIEVRALGTVFEEGRDPERPLVIGSVKTNLGHLDAAAGVAGLIKTVLALQNEAIPPHLHFRQPNPHIAWAELPVTVPTKLRPWLPEQQPRLAGVSGFGFGGTNAHVVLQEAPTREPEQVGVERPLHLLTLSAKTPEALRELASRYHAHLAANSDLSLGDVCATASAGRSHFQHRLGLVAETTAEAREQLAAFLAGEERDAIITGRARPDGQHDVAFLFTAQGPGVSPQNPAAGEAITRPLLAQPLGSEEMPLSYVGMGREFYDTQPTFRQALDRCDEILRPALERPLTEMLDASSAEGTAHAEPVVFALEYALAQVWRSWGIDPAAVGGEGVGEYVAACVAGVLTLEDGLKLVAERMRLMQTCPQESQRRAAFRQALGEVTFSAPQISVVGNVAHFRRCATLPGGSASGTEPHEQLRSQSQGSRSAHICEKALRGQGCDLIVEIGSAPTDCRPDLLCIRSSPDWPTMLCSLAKLYVQGVAVDWPSFCRGYAHRRVVLPTYPFQRQSYWVEAGPKASAAPGALLCEADPEQLAEQLAESGAFSEDEKRLLPRVVAEIVKQQRQQAETAAIQDWLYEVEWQPKPRESGTLPGSALPSPQEIREAVLPERAELIAQSDMDVYREIIPQLEAASVAYIMSAFSEMGWPFQVGDGFSTASARERLGVAPQHERLFARLLAILSEDGLITRVDDWWLVAKSLEVCEPERQMNALRDRYPIAEAELAMLARCAGRLAEVLRGECDPLQLLFPDGDLASAERLYGDAPVAQVMNVLTQKAVLSAVRQIAPARGARIIEIGAGTGGTTSYLLPHLPANTAQCVFTDLSPLFTAKARERFRDHAFVSYRVLDIEQDPETQGFGREEYDLVIAGNVLHATRDLRQTLQHVRQLLAPGGLLVLQEVTSRQRWVDLIFGLTEGWWRFADHELRPSHPLLTAPQWKELVDQNGFTEAVNVAPEADEHEVLARQAVIVAQREEEARVEAGRWLIFADRGGTARRLAAGLADKGEKCLLVYSGNRFERTADREFRIDPARPTDFERLLDGLSSRLRGVVHLWSLDAPETEDLTVPGLEAALSTGCGSVLLLVKALAKMESAVSPMLWLVTRNAQPAGERSTALAVAQSPLWGLGRVISLEYPQLWGGLIDLALDGADDEHAELLSEIWGPTREDHVAFRDGRRFVARLVRRSQQPEQPVRVDPEATYLITGGLGYLGLRVARWLAEQGARHLALTGRTGMPSRDTRAIQSLEQMGVTVSVYQADVSDSERMASVLEQIDATNAPLRGVVHAAGVPGLQAIEELDLTALQEVSRPKVAGAWVLHELTREMGLDFCVYFSSASSVWGAKQQAHYAAANHFLDALAHCRRAAGLPALSINWALFPQESMVSHEYHTALTAIGLQEMPPDKGFAAMRQLLATRATQATVARADWDRFKKVCESSRPRPLLEQIEPRPKVDAPPQTDERPELLQDLSDAPASECTNILTTHIQEKVAGILALGPSELPDPELGFFEMGVDSLMAVELHSQLESALGRSLSSTLVFDFPSIRALAAHLAAEVAVGAGGTPSPAEHDGRPATTEVGELGEEEVEESIATEMEKLESLLRDD